MTFMLYCDMAHGLIRLCLVLISSNRGITAFLSAELRCRGVPVLQAFPGSLFSAGDAHDRDDICQGCLVFVIGWQALIQIFEFLVV